MSKYSVNTRAISSAGMLAAIYAVVSWVSVPLPSGVPLSFQCFAVTLCSLCAGGGAAPASCAVYIAAGAAGLPVFSGFTGGAGVLFGLTGGFIWGFIAIAALCSAAARRRKAVMLAAAFSGVLICHAAGTLQFAAVAHVSLLSAFFSASAPYILKDLLLAGLACAISPPLRKAISGGFGS